MLDSRNSSGLPFTLSAMTLSNKMPMPLFLFTSLMLLTSTIIRGSNRSVALLAMELMALLVLLGIGTQLITKLSAKLFTPSFSKAALFLTVLISPFAIAFIQTLHGLPEASLHADLGHKSTIISLVPDAAWVAALAALPITAAFASALVANQKQVDTLIRLLIFVALLQALMGLLQLGGWEVLYFDADPRTGVIGTFANRNHLANLLVMVLPLLLWEMSQAGTAHKRRADDQTRSHLNRHTASMGLRLLWASGLLIVFGALLATLSRTGIVLGALVLLMHLIVHSNDSKRRWWGLSPQAWGLACTLLLAMVAGGWDWLARFEEQRLGADSLMRAINREDTWRAALQFWPFGSGLGSFESVFPRFQDPSLGQYFVNHAHNEYLQLLMECGVLVAPAALALMWLISWRLVELVKSRDARSGWGQSGQLALAAGSAFFAQALHAWVDYPWSIPATAMIGAFLLGVFLRDQVSHKLPAPPKMLGRGRHGA